MELLSD